MRGGNTVFGLRPEPGGRFRFRFVILSNCMPWKR